MNNIDSIIFHLTSLRDLLVDYKECNENFALPEKCLKKYMDAKLEEIKELSGD